MMLLRAIIELIQKCQTIEELRESVKRIMEEWYEEILATAGVILCNGVPSSFIVFPCLCRDAPNETQFHQGPRTYYKADGRLHEIERDVAKRWKKCMTAPVSVIGSRGGSFLE